MGRQAHYGLWLCVSKHEIKAIAMPHLVGDNDDVWFSHYGVSCLMVIVCFPADGNDKIDRARSGRENAWIDCLVKSS